MIGLKRADTDYSVLLLTTSSHKGYGATYAERHVLFVSVHINFIYIDANSNFARICSHNTKQTQSYQQIQLKAGLFAFLIVILITFFLNPIIWNIPINLHSLQIADNSQNKTKPKYLLICHGPQESSHETMCQLEKGKKRVSKPGEFEYQFIHYDPLVLTLRFNEGNTWFLYFSRLFTNGSQTS